MKLGLFTPVFNALPLRSLIAELRKYPHIQALEIGTGGWPGSSHIELDRLLGSKEASHEFLSMLHDTGLMISALSCHGNPVHPNPGVARRDDALFRKTIKLAEMLGVAVVVTFSGCPGASAQDVTPNWIATAWPPEYADALAWQWEQRLIPYWKEAAAFAATSGVKIAIEAHPGFCVYNTETLLRLRAESNSSLGINLDPSHLWWQGIDIPSAIAALGPAIFHIHAKDVAINPAMTKLNGVLDTKSYRRAAERSWIFRSVGWGHGELEWKAVVSALRLAGYDYVLSIEHEDALASTHEGLSSATNFLARVLLKEPPADPWWI